MKNSPGEPVIQLAERHSGRLPAGGLLPRRRGKGGSGRQGFLLVLFRLFLFSITSLLAFGHGGDPFLKRQPGTNDSASGAAKIKFTPAFPSLSEAYRV